MLRRTSRPLSFRGLVNSGRMSRVLREGRRRFSRGSNKQGSRFGAILPTAAASDIIQPEEWKHHAKNPQNNKTVSARKIFAARTLPGGKAEKSADETLTIFDGLEDGEEDLWDVSSTGSLRKRYLGFGKDSRLKPFGEITSDDQFNAPISNASHKLGKIQSKSQILASDEKPPSGESLQPKKRIRRPHPKRPRPLYHGNPSGLSFFAEVEHFLEKEKQINGSHGGDDIKEHRNPASLTTSASNSRADQRTTRGTSANSAKMSIFDVFRVPEPPPLRSENAFEAEAFEAYEAILEDYVKTSKDASEEESAPASALSKEEREGVDTWMRLDEPKVEVRLPTLTSLGEVDGFVHLQEMSNKALKAQAKAELREQEEVFKEQLRWSAQQYMYATKMIHSLTEFSHVSHKALPVAILWEKMKEAGYVGKKSIGVCLSAATSFSGGILSRNRSSLLISSPRNRLPAILDSKETSTGSENTHDSMQAHNCSNVPEQLALVNDLLYTPTEQSTYVRIRMLVSLGDAKNALKLVEERMAGEAQLRAYSQVFSLYLEVGAISAALFLMQKMKKGHKNVPLQPELFVQLIAAAAEAGSFCHGAGPIHDAAKLGYSNMSGPGLFDEIAREMSLYAGAISSASARRLQKAFQRGFCSPGECKHEFDFGALAVLNSLSKKASDNDLVADCVSIDPATGYCLATNTFLRLLELESHQKSQMKKGLLKLVGKGRPTEAMQSFWQWLRIRTGPRFTAIVDGANVAYYMQNFDGGRFNFAQIEFVVEALQDSGENPLVILPQKYLKDSFTIATGGQAKRQTLDAVDVSIIERMERCGCLYAVPAGMLDDYFWISATVIDQDTSNITSKKSARQADALERDSKRLGSGSHPVVVSNDQIRDHKEFELLEPKAFNRWYSNTIVNYNFTGFVGNECIDPDIAFTPADKYSCEIQGNQAENGTISWHFPVHDWHTSDWFCIRIPSRQKSSAS